MGRQERRRRRAGPSLRGAGRLRDRQGAAGRSLRRDLGTETVAADKIQAAILATFDLRPAAILDALDLLRPIYKSTAAYGHFGRTTAAGVDNPFTWERTDRVEALQRAANG